MAQQTYNLKKGDDADLGALSATSLTLSGAAVDTAVLLAAGQVVDLNGEADALVFDALQAVRMDGSTAGTLKIKISGAYDFQVTANTFTALSGSTIATNTLAETTGGSGITADGVLLKDSTVTATLIGGVQETVVAVTADGAIAVPAGSRTYFITKAGVAAMTLVDPTATTHDGIRLTFIATTAHAHTLSNAAGSGFNGGGAAKDVGTFGGAIGDGITIVAYQGKWWLENSINVTLG